MSGRGLISIDTASRISALLLKQSGELDALVGDLKMSLPEKEFHEARLLIGRVMGEMYLQGLYPLFEAHPGVKPSGLR